MATEKVFVASAESKAKAKQLRLFALLAWLVAFAGEIFAILKLIHNNTLVWLIVTIVIILVLAVTGSMLWKKANQLDPASEKDKFKFFVQNQLGAILGVLAFLPLVILILSNKEIDGKTKGIAGVVAIVAMLIAGITGIDFNPNSVEKKTTEMNKQAQDSTARITDSITGQTTRVKQLNFNKDIVYWTPEGNKYHLFEDCPHIKGHAGLTSGTVQDAFDKKHIAELCKTCEERAMKERNIN